MSPVIWKCRLTDKRLKQCFPASREVDTVVPPLVFFAAAALLIVLLECVIDGQRKPWSIFSPQGCEGLAKPTLEMFFCPLFVALEPLRRSR